MYNKKAQIGETITWVVATIIIIIILTVSIFISSAYIGGGKDLGFTNSVDSLASKSLFSYLLTTKEGKTVYEQLQEEENLNESNGDLALDIFEEFFKGEYSTHIWLGIVIDRPLFPFLPNDFFGERPTTYRGGDIDYHTVSYVSEIIQLNEDKELELMLMEE